MSDYELTEKQIKRMEYYQRPEVIERRKQYNQRPEVKEKRRISNSIIKTCECGGMYSMCHKRQHIEESPHHLHWLSTGEKKYTGEKYIIQNRIYK